MLGVELFLPGQEVFNRHRGESRELRPFENLFLFNVLLLLILYGFSIDQILMDPEASLLHNVKYQWFSFVIDDDLINFFDDLVETIPSDACKGLYLVFEGRLRVGFDELKHEVNLILKLVALVGLAEDAKFIWG